MDGYELKPCPFCGSPVSIVMRPLWQGSHGYQGCYQYDIKCDNPGCRCNIYLGENDTIYRTHEEARRNAIEHWNRRSPC